METVSDYRKNPFICQPIKKLKIDDDEILLDIENIKQHISTLYILCIKDDYKIPYQFFFQAISYELLLEVYKHLIIIKAPIRMLKNMNHFNNIIVLSDIQLQLCNIINYPLESKNIVLPNFTINYLNIQSYINQYEKYKLTNLINIIKLNHNFNYNTSNLCDLIKKLSESKYWTKTRSINFTCAFINRRFVDKNKKGLFRMDNYIGLTHSDNSNNVNKEPAQIVIGSRSKKHYTDYACKNIPYKIKTSDLTYTKINEVFNVLSKNDQEQLFMQLLVSKTHTHLVINNDYILTLLSIFIQDNQTQIKYLLSYAWIIFYLEECIQGNKTQITDRYIFSVNVACKLPYFTFDHRDPKSNPYMPLLLNDLDYDNGIFHSVNNHIIHTGGISTLETFIEKINIFITGENYNIFQGLDFKKYDICITGSIIAACGPKNIHIIHNKASTTDLTNFSNSNIKLFKDFIKNNYSDSDVDMIIKNVDITTKEGYTKFIDTVNVIYETVSLNETIHTKYEFLPQNVTHSDETIKNVDITTKEGHTKFTDTVTVICKTLASMAGLSPSGLPQNVTHSDETLSFSLKEKDKITFEEKQSFSSNETISKNKHNDTELIISPLNYLFVSKEYINKHINLDNTIINKINYVISHIDDPEILEKFKPLYEELKAQRRAEFVQKYSLDEITKWEVKYPDLLNTNNFKICISSNTTDSYSLVFTCKAHITSSNLSRKLEIFSIKENDFFSVVSTFHFPCVRGIYDGSNVYLTPSCITAFMSLMNIDYKYVCCAKDPIELILKYKDYRGYGIYLNIDEQKSIIKYIMHNEKYWENYNISKKDTYKTAYDKIFKSLTILGNTVTSSFGPKRAIDKYGNIMPLDTKFL